MITPRILLNRLATVQCTVIVSYFLTGRECVALKTTLHTKVPPKLSLIRLNLVDTMIISTAVLKRDASVRVFRKRIVGHYLVTYLRLLVMMNLQIEGRHYCIPLPYPSERFKMYLFIYWHVTNLPLIQISSVR